MKCYCSQELRKNARRKHFEEKRTFHLPQKTKTVVSNSTCTENPLFNETIEKEAVFGYSTKKRPFKNVWGIQFQWGCCAYISQ